MIPRAIRPSIAQERDVNSGILRAFHSGTLVMLHTRLHWLLALALLAGCGQTGPLQLPPPDAVSVPPAPAAGAPPAGTAPSSATD
ncbi:LPS translocon maturation chaperone LptM [Haliea alexandrii]|uniref:LPS translocon maturation chaperone LptM n=1 Tax=Haliea alexandrii TaxID=2448162 RepID=UPI0038CC13C6